MNTNNHVVLFMNVMHLKSTHPRPDVVGFLKDSLKSFHSYSRNNSLVLMDIIYEWNVWFH